MPRGRVSFHWTRYGLYDKAKKKAIKKDGKDLTFPTRKKAEKGFKEKKLSSKFCVYDRKKRECIK